MVLQKNGLDKTIFLVLVNLFIVFLGMGLVIPVMPTLMREMQLEGSTMGYLVAAFAFAQLLISPIAGKWVDSIGRKKLIVIGMFIFALSELLFGLGQDVKTLYVSRMLGGISAAFIMPAVTAFVADMTSLRERPKAMGYVAAAISAGFIIGPGIGGFLAEHGTRLPFFFAALLGLLGSIFSLVILKEPKRPDVKESNTDKPVVKSGFRKVLEPIYLIPMIIIFVSSFGLAAFETVYSLFVDYKFAFTPKDIALIITISGVLGVIAQVLTFDRIVEKIGEIRLIQICMGVSAIFIFAMIKVTAYWSILIVTFVIFLMFDLIRPALTTYLSKMAGNEQGFVGGLNSTFTSIGNIIGPGMAGILFDVNIDYPYVLSMFVLILSFVISLFWKERTN
ncbi:DHA1 family multidrug resistance protein-like MFS transporter/DHA1 family multidrug resistance protein-like MFS transporter [Psychrobacillus insolitus]|uniref:DHA1 family multidrug resistance protein-like MFS transporter/DHA1 family multidrug resistance protein-like MFS transporter n=1 Tax=Psychrobacillus insolitus TaxID=1461 RepID=A0A2W7MCJ3_9BACI|nr:MFS transporter [Psychrobacillus insolitus]PZX02962.1 DHA1 family multidrug resistance protein-like MFS transporter/DHA1 family multidrug resistance protein-like MFS transporter [Psychrobacillus insolitus]